MVGEGLAPPVHPEFHLRRIFARLLLSRRGWRPRQPACISKNGTSKAPSPTKTASNANGGVAPPENEKSTPFGVLRSLRRVDKKDAMLFYSTIRHLIESAITYDPFLS